MPLEAFETDKTVIDNLIELSREQSVNFEKKICEISSLADSIASFAIELCEGETRLVDVLAYLSDGIELPSPVLHDNILTEDIELTRSYLLSLSSFDKAMLAILLCEKASARGEVLTESDFLIGGSGNSSVVYLKSRLSDEAFEVFSEMLSSPKVSYADTFKDAAVAASRGECEYCILPLEEKGGARISGISALLYKFDLKICSVTPVFGFDGSADVKYALISNHFEIPSIAPDDDRYLEIRIPSDDPTSLSSILDGAGLMGFNIYRINTVRLSEDYGEPPYYTVVFSGEGCDFTRLLLFMTLFYSRFTPIGIYKNLE